MIGIFDSGVGGLSVFREIRKVLPDQKYIYYSDNAHCPYGEKSQEYIISRAKSITDFLISQGAEVIVVACNTATAAAISTLRAGYSIPFIGMEPAVKPAALSTKTGTIGVLATAGTLKGSKYLNTRDRFSDGVKVAEHIGKGVVELVENGIFTGEEAEALRTLDRIDFSNAALLKLNRTERLRAIDRILEYYSIHIAPGLDSLQSLEVLRSLF